MFNQGISNEIQRPQFLQPQRKVVVFVIEKYVRIKSFDSVEFGF
ncbi:hypothetical protein X971_4487 [Agrobacterium tumefaciens LBA4213 (Ach5)]|nr:hypothetical protein X971_4487 [Agrobacterium tumefaciens LBA4213 (Ach5)]